MDSLESEGPEETGVKLPEIKPEQGSSSWLTLQLRVLYSWSMAEEVWQSVGCQQCGTKK